ncbi:MAG: hypothetical protein QNJ47_21655 [Nostocaceae cyanobacterium]|nr:hypothetical protein [Nostocaceae cyanobacterium]
MDPLDKLLAELKAEYKQPQPKQKQVQPPEIKPLNQPFSSLSQGDEATDKLLMEVKADFQQKDLAVELQRQQELEAQRIKQEQIKAKQLEGLRNQAEDWLAKLDPFSPEGLWFERFAEKYASKLEAAMDYLQENL